MPAVIHWALIGSTCFTMVAMCCIAAMGVKDVRRYGWNATPNLMGFLSLWLLLETMGAVALTWMVLPEDDWLAAREIIKVVAIAGEIAFLGVALAHHVTHRATETLYERMLSD